MHIRRKWLWWRHICLMMQNHSGKALQQKLLTIQTHVYEDEYVYVCVYIYLFIYIYLYIYIHIIQCTWISRTQIYLHVYKSMHCIKIRISAYNKSEFRCCRPDDWVFMMRQSFPSSSFFSGRCVSSQSHRSVGGAAGHSSPNDVTNKAPSFNTSPVERSGGVYICGRIQYTWYDACVWFSRRTHRADDYRPVTSIAADLCLVPLLSFISIRLCPCQQDGIDVGNVYNRIEARRSDAAIACSAFVRSDLLWRPAKSPSSGLQLTTTMRTIMMSKLLSLYKFAGRCERRGRGLACGCSELGAIRSSLHIMCICRIL